MSLILQKNRVSLSSKLPSLLSVPLSKWPDQFLHTAGAQSAGTELSLAIIELLLLLE